MKKRLVTIFAGLVLTILSAQAAFRDLLVNYITSVNNVAVVMAKINNQNEAKANAAALDAAVTAMNAAKAQVAAGATNGAEVSAAAAATAADTQKATAALAEQLTRIRKNREVAQVLDATLKKLQ